MQSNGRPRSRKRGAGGRYLLAPACQLTAWSGLAIAGMLAAFAGIAGLIGSYPGTSSRVLDFAGRLGSTALVGDLRGPVEELARNDLLAAGLIASGLLLAMPSASAYVSRWNAAAAHLNGERLDAPHGPRSSGATALLAGSAILTLVLIAIVLTGPPARAAVAILGQGDAALAAWSFGKWPLIAASLTAIFVALFRTALDVDRAAVRAFSTGRLLALAAWAVVAAGLVFYVSHFGAVNETYGGLGAALITLLWLTMLSVLYYVTPSMRLRGLGELAPGLVVAVAAALLGAAVVAVAIARSDPLASPGGALGALLLVVLWLSTCNVALLHGVRLNLTVDGRDSMAPPEWRHVVEPGDGMSSSSTDDADAATLAQVVAAALGDEIAHRGMWSVLPGGASEAPAVLSDLECDLNDWGFAYGVAWAVAKARFPLDEEGQTAERALEAATIVFRDYCGGVDWSQRLATRREAGVLG